MLFGREISAVAADLRKVCKMKLKRNKNNDRHDEEINTDLFMSEDDSENIFLDNADADDSSAFNTEKSDGDNIGDIAGLDNLAAELEAVLGGNFDTSDEVLHEFKASEDNQTDQKTEKDMSDDIPNDFPLSTPTNEIESYIMSKYDSSEDKSLSNTNDENTISENEVKAPVYADNAPVDDTLPDGDELRTDELSPIENPEDIDFESPDTESVGSTDMNLRIAFGLEEEDKDSDRVKKAVQKLGDKLEADTRVGRKNYSDHPEFTDPIQAREIAAEYKKKKFGVTVRLILAFFFALILIFFENITTISSFIIGEEVQFAGPLDPAVYPVVHIMASLQLLFCTAFCALPELKRGARRLFLSPTPESMSVILLAAGVVYSAISAVTATVTHIPVMYNAVSAVALVMTLVYSRLNIKREMMTFYVAGSKRRKYAITASDGADTAFDADEYDDAYGEVLRVEHTNFIDGFFSRLSVPDSMTRAFITGVMGVAVAAAVIFGIFSGRGGAGVSEIASNVYIVLLALLPMSAYLTFSYPFYRVCKSASHSDSAVIGETSLDEYAAASVITFDDGSVFPSVGVKVQNIRIYNNARIDRVLYYASSVFAEAGGPLADVFEVATIEIGRSDKSEILGADTGYLKASVDGVNIVFGSYAALTQKGFEISEETARDDVDFSDEMSIMYMFRENMLVAKMYIKYAIDSDIEATLKQFDDYGMYVCIRTYDPNIDEDMIESKLSGVKNPPIKVARYSDPSEAGGVSLRVDSGLVSCSSSKALLQLLPYCDKTVHTKRTCAALSVMSVIISIMLLAVFNMSDGLERMNSLYIMLYQLVWMIPSYLASKIFIR